MALLQRLPSPPIEAASSTPTAPATSEDLTSTSPTRNMPRTRTGATWFGICAAAVTLVVIIVFMLQNTRSVEVSFLWMHGTLPLALGLLIAGVGTAIAVMVVGTARITQLHRHSRQLRPTVRLSHGTDLDSHHAEEELT
jgi:lipopolysaccharide assembly protein A